MDRLLGVFFVALSAVCFGTNAIFARFAYHAGTNPLTFLFFRFTIASGWVAICAGALFSTAFGGFMLFEGLKRIDASSSAIISTLEVIVAIVLAVIILGESVTFLKVTGTVLVLSAVAILVRGEYQATQPPVLKVR